MSKLKDLTDHVLKHPEHEDTENIVAFMIGIAENSPNLAITINIYKVLRQMLYQNPQLDLSKWNSLIIPPMLALTNLQKRLVAISSQLEVVDSSMG